MNSGSIKTKVNLHGSIIGLGARGYSNYEIAVQNGFEGTEQEWLDSLVGPVGPIGPNNFYVGEEEPEDENVSVWLDTDEPIPNTFVPVATEETLGTIKPGNNLKVDKNGKLEMSIYANNVEEMVNSKLKTNDVVQTLGYYEPNDGGGALYLIREKTENDVEDKGSIHFVGDKLVAELIIQDYIDVKQFGAKGDNETDDYVAFNNVFKYISNKLNGSVCKYNINIPKGFYKIKQEDIFKGCRVEGDELLGKRIFHFIVNGNLSQITFEGFTGNCMYNNNKFAFVKFNDIMFKSTEDEFERNLIDSYSTEGVQSFLFENCSFTGYFDKVVELRGSLCNSEWIFNNCQMSQFSKWNNFMYSDAENGSDDFLNYWFNNCRYWASSNMLHFEKGGHIVLNNCDFSVLEPDEIIYLFELGSDSLYGAGGYGTQSFIDNNSRYELKNGNIKVINAYWTQGQILFNGCDFSSSSHLHDIAEDVYKFKSINGIQNVKFRDCKLFGQITTMNKGVSKSKVEVDNCVLYNDKVKIEDCYKTERYNNATHYFDIKFTNCFLLNGERIKDFTTNHFTTKNANLSIIASSNINAVDGNIGVIFLDWIEKINVPTLIKNIYIIPYMNGDGYDREVIIKSLTSTVSNISGKTVTVPATDIHKFQKGMKVLINGIKYKITYVNKYNAYFEVEVVNEGDTISIVVDNEIHIIVGNYVVNASGTKSAIYQSNEPIMVYNDLTIEIVTTSSSKSFYGNIIVESIQ